MAHPGRRSAGSTSPTTTSRPSPLRALETEKSTSRRSQILLSRPQRLEPEALIELRDALKAAPEHFTEENLQRALRSHLPQGAHRHHLDGQARGAGHRTAADRRGACQGSACERVTAGRELTGEQTQWLDHIQPHLVQNLSIDREDFDVVPVSPTMAAGAAPTASSTASSRICSLKHQRGAGSRMTDVVGKLWGFCHTLRHDGVDYGDYIEQITYLLFLKMADERASTTAGRRPTGLILRGQSGVPTLLDALRRGPARSASSPASLATSSLAPEPIHQPGQPAQLISLIDETEWTALDVDVKAAAFEGLLEKAAAEGKKGAGQYFTPRPLIQSMVRCMQPDPRVSKRLRDRRSGMRHRRLPRRGLRWLKDQTRRRLRPRHRTANSHAAPTTGRSSWRGRAGSR